MKIAFIDDEPELYPQEVGGKARTIRAFARALAGSPSLHQVLIASRSLGHSATEFEEEGVRFQRLDGYGIVGALRQIARDYDVVNVHTCSFTFPRLENSAARLVNHLHDVIFATSDAGSHLDKALGNDWSGVIAPSEFAAQTLCNVGWWSPIVERIAVVPRIIDHTVFTPMDKSEARRGIGRVRPDLAAAIGRSYPVVLFPHRGGANKGHDELIALQDMLKRRYTNPLIVTTGCAAVRPHCLDAGWLSKQGLRQLYAAADVCLVLSRLPESFSQVPLEAVACGLPSVCTRFGNLATLIDTTPGLYETKPMAEEASEAIALALEEGARMVSAGGDAVRDRYSPARLVPALLDAYERMSSQYQVRRSANLPPPEAGSRYFVSPRLALYGNEAFIARENGAMRRLRLTPLEREFLTFCAMARTPKELTQRFGRFSGEHSGALKNMCDKCALIEG